MFDTPITHAISDMEFETILDAVAGYETQDPTLARVAKEVVRYRTFTLTTGDGESLHGFPYTTGDRDEPGDLDVAMVLTHNQKERGWVLPEGRSSEIDPLPTVEYVDDPSPHGPWTIQCQYRFADGTTAPASRQPEHPDETTEIVAAEPLRDDYKQKFILQTAAGEHWYLRAKNGAIRVFNTVESLDQEHRIFSAGITWKYGAFDHERLFEILASADHIEIADDLGERVDDAVIDRYYDARTQSQTDNRDDDLNNSIGFDEAFDESDP